MLHRYLFEERSVVRGLIALPMLVAVAAGSAGAAEPTAHEPHFDDRGLWPHLTGKEPFVAARCPRGDR